MSDDSSPGQYTRLMVRISEGLRRKLASSAESGGRSLSAEMLLRIERSFESDDEAAAVRDRVDDHEERIKELERDIIKLLDRTGISYED
jgi:hypothetical protein